MTKLFCSKCGAHIEITKTIISMPESTLYVEPCQRCVSRWISVEDELPKTGLDVLSCIDGKKYSVEIGWIDKENIWSMVRENTSPMTRKPPTHWAPLPKAKGT